MAKAVFTTKPEPGYDDLPEERYHFPNDRYLRKAREAVGDWILYYEPRRSNTSDASRGGRMVYFATAFVERVEQDPADAGHSYAFVSQYMEFPRPVPFREGGLYYEQGLRRPDGKTNKGAFGQAVRILSDVEYQTILAAGFTRQFDEPEWEPLVEWEARPVVERVVARPYRDRAFQRVVRRVYHDTCAFTGLRLINGGGRPEIESAHIRPVEADGPDSVRNGLALTRTIHWMFDRHLISLEDDGKILVAEKLVPKEVRRILRPEGYIELPERRSDWPHPAFLRHHRERFKG